MPRLDDREVETYTAFACRLAELAGHAILPHFRAALTVENKAAGGGYDPVTVADRAAEQVIRDEIARVYPDHGICGEEYGSRRGREGLTWVIDPIDGTRAFVIGLLHWGVLVALNDGEHPVIGVMHQPYVGETFVGSRFGAELRRGAKTRRLRTRRCGKIADAIVCATDPAMFSEPGEREAFHTLTNQARARRYGTDCYAYSLLATGLADLVIESRLKPYDIQPLIPIIEGAGGIVTSWAGGNPNEGGQVIAAGDLAVHTAALQLLKPASSQ